MKEYVKPEIELKKFHTESILANEGSYSLDDGETTPIIFKSLPNWFSK